MKAPVVPLPDAPAPSVHTRLLERWMALGEVQRRAAGNLAAEVTQASTDLAAEAGTLSQLFQALALKADAQNSRVARLASIANLVEMNGKVVPLTDVAAVFEHNLSGIISKILLLSQNAMAMVFAFERVNTSIAEVERCIREVNKINSQTQILAINARIEAARAGEAGRAFGVISDEVRALSGGTQDLANRMRQHVGAVLKELHDSHEVLRTVASVDMTENIMAKETLDLLVGALVQRGTQLGAIAEDAKADAGEISRQVGEAVVCLQFQDRVSQHLGHVVQTLGEVGKAVTQVQQETGEATGVSGDLSLADAPWLADIAARYSLSKMRESFVCNVIEGRDTADDDGAGATEAGSIELF